MTDALTLDGPEAVRAVERLAPYARATLEAAARTARRLHAEEVAPEHLLLTILEDEEAGATRLVLHAFADPETIAGEVLALCPGILVVGSGRSLPFSVRGVAALEEARRRAVSHGAGEVTPGDVLAAAVEELEEGLRDALEAAGLHPFEPAPAAEAAAASEPLFRFFSQDARRALGTACRVAGGLGRGAIGPAHLILGCLEAAPDLEVRCGLGATRARMVLVERDEDPTPVAGPPPPLSGELVRLLGGLDEGADTTAVLGRVLSHGTEELRLLLVQQRITPALHGRAREAFGDPEVREEG